MRAFLGSVNAAAHGTLRLMAKTQRVLISVTDKSGIAEFARELHNFGAELISTGGTAKLLREAGVPVRDVSDVTGFPEMLDGRVKTMHPKITGGILAMRGKAEHMRALDTHRIQPIDMVVVNLYAFEDVAAKAGATLGGFDREHRHRRPHHDPLGGQELPGRGGSGFARRLRRHRRGDESGRRGNFAGNQVAAGAESVSDNG